VTFEGKKRKKKSNERKIWRGENEVREEDMFVD